MSHTKFPEHLRKEHHSSIPENAQYRQCWDNDIEKYLQEVGGTGFTP